MVHCMCLLGLVLVVSAALYVSSIVPIHYSFIHSFFNAAILTTILTQMAGAVVDAIQTIYAEDRPLDLHRVEILALERKTATDSRFVKGLVLDHGARHPDMPTLLKNVKIMICNISLEYEQAETQAGFVYSTAEEREKLVESERIWLDERCRKIVEFKRQACKDGNESFCIINQKGVDPLSLDMFAKEGILCLRRAKRRNMERLALATGGQAILSLEDLDLDHLGYAGQVSEETYGEDKYTFVEDCPERAVLHPPAAGSQQTHDGTDPRRRPGRPARRQERRRGPGGRARGGRL